MPSRPLSGGGSSGNGASSNHNGPNASIPYAPGGGNSGMILTSPTAGTNLLVKRPADSAIEDDSPGSAPGGKMKLPRLDRGGEDFSAVVKNRLSSYTRTGQACDRCKVRKIRCDALPEGCSACINLQLECYVTDRVTGRTERRGYLQQLEREKESMLDRIQDLEKLLGEKGVDVKPWTSAAEASHPPGHSLDAASSAGWVQKDSLWVKERPSSTSAKSLGTEPAFFPNFPRSQLPSRPDDSSLRVGWDSRPMSSINGTRLTIMGTTIDTASFEAPDMDEPSPGSNNAAPLYNKSVQAFLQSAMGINPPMQAELPARQEAFTYSEWYFLVMSCYIPVLHRPTFMEVLRKIYDDNTFKPTIPELVIVHMVFAIIYYQYGIRNWQEVDKRNQLNNLSNRHYHYSLSKFFDLMSSRDLEAIQALVLIASHTRAFPKPGCGTIISALAFQRALDLNLHRAPKVPESGTNLNIEIRKRTWWVLLTVYVAVTGRRGRPMPITVEEFDVGFPEPVDDDLLSESGLDTSRPGNCRFIVGLATFKMIPIMMEMYSNLYSVRVDTQNYANVVYALERKLQQWEDDLPESLRLDRPDKQYDLAALYVKMFALELRIWMRHNSVNPSTEQKMMAENTRICEETARELLRVVQQVIKLKSLDATWSQASIYAMSLFSMLVAYWDRRDQTTKEQLVVLRQEMDGWMDVLKELSLLMGSGAEIQNEIAAIVDRTIAWIEQSMKHGSAKPTHPGPTVRLKKEITQPQDRSMEQIPSQDAPVVNAPSAQEVPQQHVPSNPPRQYYQDPAPPLSAHAQYANAGYGDPGGGVHPQQYNAEANAMFYPANGPDPAAVAVAAAAAVTGGENHSNSLISFPPQPATWHRGGNTWNDWTAAMTGSHDPHGVGALMALGGPTSMAPAVRGSMAGGAAHDMSGGAQWPLIMFDQAPPPHVSHHAHAHAHHHGSQG